MEQPSYYAVIPANVRYDKSICAGAKLLFGEITALCNEKGFCWAGNDYFAGLYGVSKETVSRWISKLTQKGYLKMKIFYKHNSKEIDKRIIAISTTTKIEYPIDENINTPCENNQSIPIDENINTPRQKNQDPIDENIKENITSINNINNIYSRVIDYLNQKTGKNYKHTTKKTQDLIKARLRENFKEEDFKKVIETKTKEWKNDKAMCKYLRPETLFGTKFEGYLNQEDSTVGGGVIEDTYNTDFSEYDKFTKGVK